MNTTPAQNITEAVAQFRDANRRIRVMVKNGGLQGRNSNATLHGIQRWQAVADQAMRVVRDAGERRIAGLLTEEASLIDNIAKSVTKRPDLQSRLTMTRRDVRRRMQYLNASVVGAWRTGEVA